MTTKMMIKNRSRASRTHITMYQLNTFFNFILTKMINPPSFIFPSFPLLFPHNVISLFTSPDSIILLQHHHFLSPLFLQWLQISTTHITLLRFPSINLGIFINCSEKFRPSFTFMERSRSSASTIGGNSCWIEIEEQSEGVQGLASFKRVVILIMGIWKRV
uniref:Uncharacterized protein n=1 Tax=Opuntia streptacantha TaxID=393608 RepID=A0A7C8Z4F0_OPUST